MAEITKSDLQTPNNSPASDGEVSQYHLQITPEKGWVGLRLDELWEYRELIFFLSWRNVTVRYKQTVLGILWAVIQPLTSVVIFTIIFGGLANIPSDGLPYPIFSYAAMLPWNFFASSLSGSSDSVVANAALLKKIYFPRLVIPFTAVTTGVVDFGISFVMLLILMALYGIVPTVNIIFLPFFLLIAFMTSLGVGMWFSALNAQFRDVKYLLTYGTQFWFYLTPVVYPSSLIENDFLRSIYGINPMAGVVEGFRWALLGVDTPPGIMTLVSTVTATVLFVSGMFYFRRMEKTFADVV